MTEPSSPDLSEFVELSKPRKPCQVGVIVNRLGAADRAALQAALAADSTTITVGGIRAWLARRDHEASNSAISYHRRRSCTCPKGNA